MLLFFAASLTAACSLISVRLVRSQATASCHGSRGKEDLDLESEASSATQARVHDSTRAPHTPASHLCWLLLPHARDILCFASYSALPCTLPLRCHRLLPCPQALAQYNAWATSSRRNASWLTPRDPLLAPLPLRRLLNWRAVLVQVVRLLEQTFGYVVGCAWTNFVIAITPLMGFNT